MSPDLLVEKIKETIFLTTQKTTVEDDATCIVIRIRGGEEEKRVGSGQLAVLREERELAVGSGQLAVGSGEWGVLRSKDTLLTSKWLALSLFLLS